MSRKPADQYLSLDLEVQGPCAASLGARVAFPVDGGPATIDEASSDKCAMKLTLNLEKTGQNFKLTVTEPHGKPIPVALTLGNHVSVRLAQLNQGEVDLVLTRHGR